MLCGGFGNNVVPNNNNKFQLQSFVNMVVKVRIFGGGGVVLPKENSVPACVCERNTLFS